MMAVSRMRFTDTLPLNLSTVLGRKFLRVRSGEPAKDENSMKIPVLLAVIAVSVFNPTTVLAQSFETRAVLIRH